MITRCSYLDCLYSSEINPLEAKKGSLFNTICPQCKRLFRVKSLDIIEKLLVRQKQNSNLDNTEIFPFQSSKFAVLLEDIRSLWNVGSIFRTADAAQIEPLFLSGITGCPPRSEITKTALGADEILDWHYAYSPIEIILALKSKGHMIIGLERNEHSLSLIDCLKEKRINSPVCLVVGNENSGLSPETIANCDLICDLPMKGAKESLNVASAFAVAAYFINEYL